LLRRDFGNIDWARAMDIVARTTIRQIARSGTGGKASGIKGRTAVFALTTSIPN
jgi:hypothetical protein